MVMELFDVMVKRRSVRNYTDEKIPADKLEKILQAALLAPTSRNICPCEFIVVQDDETLQKLSKAKNAGSAMIAQAACAIVVVGDGEKTDVWCEDCSIAMTYMHIMATDLGLGSCWVQCRLRRSSDGRSAENYVRELLSIPENYCVEAILALGIPESFPEANDIDKLKLEKIHREKF